MSYYPTLAEDVERAREILAKGKLTHAELDAGGITLDDAMQQQMIDASGTIFGGDVFAAYKLLESFVEAIEAVGPKVAELALRHQQRASYIGPVPPSVSMSGDE